MARFPKPKPGGPVDRAIGHMTGDTPFEGYDDATDSGAVKSPMRKPKGAPRGHPFKKGGTHKHGGKPFPKRC